MMGRREVMEEGIDKKEGETKWEEDKESDEREKEGINGKGWGK